MFFGCPGILTRLLSSGKSAPFWLSVNCAGELVTGRGPARDAEQAWSACVEWIPERLSCSPCLKQKSRRGDRLPATGHHQHNQLGFGRSPTGELRTRSTRFLR